ncbi:Vps16, C-terminal region-domain-containing protein [Kockovaella imperatae]|uniref:Probable vacuolar protein sorting-associated protein 16 homolog n=1 Tax=Kockovaella imperatae TaxID=4999 RepID=A0A1Y1UQ13_9TREE|nr:Vps16, C-terminal region-domain-containing protein [Kockovaella imperatae]ORX39657.1 Vps16, C-terminal region-domain-containing protein [Kockovaella imperatae]
MSVPAPTSSWDTIKNVFYRKDEVYQMSWQIPDLSDYLVAVGKNGGPIAIMRDERKVMLLGKHMPGKPKIYMYTSSGLPIDSFAWDLSPPVLLHFTPTHLLVVSDEGTYRLYDLSNPGSFAQHTLGGESGEMGVVFAVAYNDGFVVFNGGLHFMEVKGWHGARPIQLTSSQLTEPPSSWTVVPPDQSISGHVEVLISTGSTIITLDSLERIDQRIDRGPFNHILLSPNGRFLALITVSGMLWVVSSDFARSLSEVEISQIEGLDGHEGPVEQAAWCGDNAVVLRWGGKVVVVGPGGAALRYDYSPSAELAGEIDGLRIISSSTCDFVQKVPDPSLAVFRPGSDHPAAILFDALDHFERKSPKADESIRAIRPELASAVDTCIEAAGRETEPHWQKKLLRAAQFGRAFMDLYNPSDFVTMGQTLKVLNAVRYFEIGIPITYEQYLASSATSLITHLISRNLHLLALRISQHLGLRPDMVLKHWATAKISHAREMDGQTDEAICQAIVAKFEKEGERSVSYAEIAKKAWESGRTTLATMLLDHELRAAEQVPLLLQMKENKVALVKAIASGDTDLVYHVLLHLRRTLSPGDFFHILDDSVSPGLTPAVKLLQVYAREGDRQLLRDFYYQDDRRTETACLEMEEAGASQSQEQRLDHLAAAAQSFGQHKDRAFEAKMTDDAHRLLTLQLTYEKELSSQGLKFAGLSVNQFIYELLLAGVNKRAEKVRADWKVPDKRFWWIKLKALAALKDWDGLEAFAKSKKSPIGYEPFVTHLLSLSPPHPSQAATFVPRCDPKARSDLYVKCAEWGKAAEAAKERGDKAKLEQLRRTAPSGLAQRDVDQVIKSMTK